MIECHCGKQVAERHPSCVRAHTAARGHAATRPAAREERQDVSAAIQRMTQHRRDELLRGING